MSLCTDRKWMLPVVAAVLACSPVPAEITSESATLTAGSTANSTVGSTTGPSAGDSTTTSSTTNTPSASSSGPAADSTGSGTTEASTDSSSDTSGTTGEPPPQGCADGQRDALLDEVTYPDIAACAGGFGVAGVQLNTPTCGRQGGDDGPFPDGMACAIDDLCSEGWHVCRTLHEVSNSGLADCDGPAWATQFFATAQSGTGSNTCGATGTNDVFGCGDIGHPKIMRCGPLNRSTGNECVEIAGPWICDQSPDTEAVDITKTGPTHGGALCCRDPP